MAKDVIMPALGMAQETGTLLAWRKAPGDAVTKGEPLMEIETDKTTVEIEAAASGVLANVTAQPGDVIPVGQVIAVILAAGEAAPDNTDTKLPETHAESTQNAPLNSVNATPVAQRIAAEHQLDLAQVKPGGGRIGKDDVLAFLASKNGGIVTELYGSSRTLASPKARKLAQERGLELRLISGSGPGGAVVASDVAAAVFPAPTNGNALPIEPTPESEAATVSRIWQIMAERITQAWTTIPHFYLLREVNAAHLISWMNDARTRSTEKITYTDLLVRVTAAALRQHPRLNASWRGGTVAFNADVNVGLAVAVEDGLLVPVIHNADTLGLSQLAARRVEIVARAQASKLTPDDLSAGTFTISNLGMYGVDAFNAIVNPPQAAILAVSRIADRVVPLNGVPAVQPMITLSLSCDHRIVDGARGAQFLQTIAEMIENPLRLLD